jgi:integrase
MAFDDKKVASNAEWARVKPFKGVNVARKRYLEIAETKRLINACQGDFRLLVQAALITGARYGELARLKVEDFKRASRTLEIKTSKSGKGRHVYLTEEGAAFFAQLCAGRPGNATMLHRGCGEPWGRSHQFLPMQAACKRANITPPISFHGLRHTWASHAVMSGEISLQVAAQALGHRDTRMVEEHYGHLAQSYVADAIRKGSPRFGFKPDKKIVVMK